ncbi:MAG: ribulokinase [Clostridia bacterium]|nr:ribulokinase [Clostridia bacterium]
MKKYSIGIDYGTLSARAVLVELTNGTEVASSEFVYPHGVMGADEFPGLERSSAIQHPQDYLDAMSHTMRDIVSRSGVDAADIVGMGIDFTACTVLPVDENGTPLCFKEKFKDNPHAHVKLWKHHGAQAEADLITRVAEEEKEPWLDMYGKKVSSEWFFPKLLEVLNKAPEVYAETFRYIEAADWLVWQLTGVESHSSCMAGYKALWNKSTGYPSNEFWGKVHSGFGDIIGTKVSEKVSPAGTEVGKINDSGAALTGLAVGTSVAAPVIDAHAALPAAGIVGDGKLMIIIGTSSCHIVMDKEDKPVDGICGRVNDGIIPGYVAYEAGQSCVGDNFDWFIKNCIPEKYEIEARESGKNIFVYVTEKAEKLAIGESGLAVLDWWNGNRSPLADMELSGLILGLTLQTKPEEIYRAIIEATAFGTKAIIDSYEAGKVKIDEIYAAGGISQKNPFLMQIYADVTGKSIKVAASTQAGAKGSAVFGALAGGYFADADAAAGVIADKCEIEYHPIAENTKKYEKLYKEYQLLTEYFGKGGNDVMKRLKNFITKA